jgi:ribosome-associated protein
MAIPAHRRAPRTKALVQLEELVLSALNDMKAINVRVMDVRGLTDVADTMIIASGTSDRHVRAIAELVIERAKQGGRRPMGTEGRGDAEWVLVDLQDVLVHVMLPRVREFYALEQLWEAPAASRSDEEGAARAKGKSKAKAKATGKAKGKTAGRARGAPRGAGTKTARAGGASRGGSKGASRGAGTGAASAKRTGARGKTAAPRRRPTRQD